MLVYDRKKDLYCISLMEQWIMVMMGPHHANESTCLKGNGMENLKASLTLSLAESWLWMRMMVYVPPWHGFMQWKSIISYGTDSIMWAPPFKVRCRGFILSLWTAIKMASTEDVWLKIERSITLENSCWFISSHQKTYTKGISWLGWLRDCSSDPSLRTYASSFSAQCKHQWEIWHRKIIYCIREIHWLSYWCECMKVGQKGVRHSPGHAPF